MSARLRLAVSAAAPLHVGSARIALANWLLARRLGGQLCLRLDEAGAGAEPQEALRRDLRWLGLDWDAELRQSSRGARHAAAAERLKSAGRLYPCFESEAELAAKRDRRLRQGKPSVYDRAMLKLTPGQREAAEAGGKRPYWRFRLSDRAMTWRDLVAGERAVKLPALSDPVMLRADGTPLPGFAGAVDDLEDGITHVVRGDDMANASAIQRDLTAALGGDPDGMALAHLPVLVDAGGARLSRRSGNFSLRALRHRGVEPAALAHYLAGGGGERPLPLAELAAGFSPVEMAEPSPRFDLRGLLAVNRTALAALPFAAVVGRLPAGATEAFWMAVRGSIDLLTEARGYWDVVAGTIVPPIVEGEALFLRAALDHLPPEPWDGNVWSSWTELLRQATGRADAGMVPPLRLALTGEEHGPELPALLPLIGRVRVAQRLAVAAG